jgi:hypothetical protein
LESLGLTLESFITDKDKSQAEEKYDKVGQQSQYVPHRNSATLQPAKLYTVALENTPEKLRDSVKRANWRKDKMKLTERYGSRLPSIVRIFDAADYDNDPVAVVHTFYQEWDEDQGIFKMYEGVGNDWIRRYSFSEDEVYRGKGREVYNGNKFVSSFQSEITGTLKLQLKREVDRGKRLSVRFSDVIVYFY